MTYGAPESSRILLVCSDSTAAQALTQRLNRIGHAVCAVAPSGPRAVELAADLRPDLALIDLGQDAGVVEAAGRIANGNAAPVVYLVGDVDETLLGPVRKTGPAGYVAKPLGDDRQLRLTIDAALSRAAAGRREREHRDRDHPPSSEPRERIYLLSALLDSMTEGVVAAGVDGGILFSNSALRRMFGLGGRRIGSLDQGEDEYELLGSDQRTPFPASEVPLYRAMRGELSDATEMFVRRRNDAADPGLRLSVVGRPLRDARGRLSGGIAVVRDITRQGQATERLAEAERELRKVNEKLQHRHRFMRIIFDTISDGVVVTDENGRLSIGNASARRMVPMDLTAAPWEQWSEIYGFFRTDGVTPFPPAELPLVRAIHGESSDDVEVLVRNPHVPDGSYFSVDGRPVRDRDGRQIGALTVARDVTQRFRAREALLRAFDHGRLEVIETVLHNIGNAINSVATGVETIRRRCGDNELLCRFVALGDAIEAHEEDWIDWLRGDPQGRQVRGFLLALIRDLEAWNASLTGAAERAAARVQHIVDIVRNQEALKGRQGGRRLVRLRSMLDDAVKVLGDSLAARGVRVSVDCTAAPDEILTEEYRFTQMVVNLLKNAMESLDDRAGAGGDAEPVEPRIDVLACTRRDRLVLGVTDNGIGIAPERVRDVFRAGYTTKPLGSGLGLHSVANFVVAGGGSVDVRSDGVGRGATMEITLPLGPLRQPEEAP